MASTEYDFNLTRTEIIDRSLRIVGAISPGQTGTPNQQEACRIALNGMVSRWQSDHIFLWAQDAVEIPLVDATKTYALSNDPQILSVDKAYIRVGNNDTTLEIIGWDEYNDLPDKSSNGDPNRVAVDFSTTGATLYTYPTIVTASSKKLFLLVTVKLKDFDNANSNPDLRSAWLDALSYGLASNISDEYSLSISERQHIEKKANDFYRGVKKTDKKRPSYYAARGAY